jgi:hypothetical protein
VKSSQLHCDVVISFFNKPFFNTDHLGKAFYSLDENYGLAETARDHWNGLDTDPKVVALIHGGSCPGVS